MQVKNKKNKLLYLSSFVSMGLTAAISALSYNNDTPSLDISLQLNNSTFDNSTVENIDLIKDFIYSSFSPKEINLIICIIIMVLNLLNSLIAYLNTKKIDEKEKAIVELNTELERVTNQAQSVQIVSDYVNNGQNQNTLPSPIESYGGMYVPSNVNNEPYNTELQSNMTLNTLNTGRSNTSIFPTPKEIK